MVWLCEAFWDLMGTMERCTLFSSQASVFFRCKAKATFCTIGMGRGSAARNGRRFQWQSFCAALFFSLFANGDLLV